MGSPIKSSKNPKKFAPSFKGVIKAGQKNFKKKKEVVSKKGEIIGKKM